MVDDKEGICKLLLDYNFDLLSRQEHPAQFEELYAMKRELMANIMDTKHTLYTMVTEEEYLRVIRKIMTKDKKMFSDFLDSGPVYKTMIFYLIKLIYDCECSYISPLITNPLPPSHQRRPDPGSGGSLLRRVPLDRTSQPRNNDCWRGGGQGGGEDQRLGYLCHQRIV